MNKTNDEQFDKAVDLNLKLGRFVAFAVVVPLSLLVVVAALACAVKLVRWAVS